MKKIVISLLLIFTLSINCLPVFASGDDARRVEKIQQLVNLAQEQKTSKGHVDTATLDELEYELQELGINTSSYGGTHDIITISARGYGETHDLGKGWNYRVDRPDSGAGKPHVHVNNKKEGINSVENVDGTKSHGKNFNESGVPKDVQKKVRDSKDYKKGQKDLEKMKEAKAEIKKQKLDMNKWDDILIAAGIFVAIVGTAFFAPEALPAALLLI